MFSDVGTVTAIIYKVMPSQSLSLIRILTLGGMGNREYSCNYQPGDGN